MSWKVRLLLVFMVACAAAIWVKLPSQATKGIPPAKSIDTNTPSPGLRVEENGFVSVQASGFAVSEPARFFPNEADELIRNNITQPDRRKERAEKERIEREAKGLGSGEGTEINKQNAEVLKKVVPGAGAGYGPFQDPLVGRDVQTNAPQAMPTPSLTFDGVPVSAPAVAPPDTNADVSPTQIVQTTNRGYAVWDKSGNQTLTPRNVNTLFASLPATDPCRVRDDGDPIVLYDSLADRWLISQFAIPAFFTQPAFQCIAISQTSDATGAYYVYSFQMPNNKLNDYPHFGVWSDGYYMTDNQFISGTQFGGGGIFAFNRAKMLVGDPTANYIYKDVFPVDPDAGGMLPADVDGYVAPPTGLPCLIMEFRADEFGDPADALRIYEFVPDYTTPGNSTFTVRPDVTLAAFDARQPPGRGDIEQSGGENLDSISDRLMHRLTYRNLGTAESPVNSFVGYFNVNVSGVNPTNAGTYQTGLRWFELRRTGTTTTVFDQGTHTSGPVDGATGLNNWMASIAQDNAGNLAIGFSQSSSTQNGDIKIAGRTNNVMNSGTLNEGEALFFDALGSQTATANRWGDYSSMSVDPVDDCTFWYTQEYYATTGSFSWRTRIGKFAFPNCTPAQKGTITGTITRCDGGAPINGALVGATGGFARATVPAGTYSMTVAPGTYTVTASKSGGFSPTSQSGVVVSNGGTATVNLCLTAIPIVTNPTPAAIVTESCGTPNNAPDPGENLTVSLSLQNTGQASTTNLTATLQATGGVTNPGPAQSYGALAPGGAAVTRNHTFTVNPATICGGTITLTWNLTDGATNFGTVTRTFSTGTPIVNLTQNFDSVTPPALPTGWTNVQTSGTGINWTTVNTTPSSTPNVAFANDPATVNAAALVTPAVQVQSANAQLSFKNWFDTEATAGTTGYDGVVLEYTTNGGTTWTDVITGGGTFVSGGYNKTISTGFMSPIAGRQAWSGNSGGGTTSVYIDTVVNLPASLNGQTVQFRWLMASDSSIADVGARVDDVQIVAGVQCQSCGPTTCRIQRRNDYDGDGKADFSVYRASNTTWFVMPSGGPQGSFYGVPFGVAGDRLQPGDYDGDGKTDIAVFRPGNPSVWWWIESSTGAAKSGVWGLSSDIPVVGDYTGDGKADLAIYRNGVWWVRRSEDGSVLGIQWGGDPTDVPLTGDFDNDCKADFAVRRTTNQPDAGATDYFILQSTAGFNQMRFGRNDQLPAVGDYDGDGKSEVGVAWLVGGIYYWYSAETGSPTHIISAVQLGVTNDIPVPADYDGDNKTDLAVWRPSTGTFIYLRSGSGNSQASQAFGVSTDTPTARWYQQPLP